MIINLADHKDNEVKFFSGRPRGETVRLSLNLDSQENNTTEITVIVPDDVNSIHTSFFLGLFGPSVRKCGSRESFLNKFKFNCPEELKEDIDEGIDLALKKSNVLK